MRHDTLLQKNPRMALHVNDVVRLNDAQQRAITRRARAIRRGEVGAGP